MQWQLGREMGTIPAFASRTQENQENLGRDGKTWVEMAKPGSRWLDPLNTSVGGQEKHTDPVKNECCYCVTFIPQVAVCYVCRF